MNGINIPEFIYKILSEDTEIKKYIDVDNNIVPLMTPPTSFPFIMYNRESVEPVYTKDGLSEDIVRMKISVIDNDYFNSCKILSRIREIFEYKKFVSKNNTNTYYNIFISLITVESISEDFVNDSYVLTIDLNFKITY